ncbi:MAG: 2-C-methyl-D-erythritol 4-phosphate cytidylyltransferase, partial [Pseudomonadota bacterium]
MNRIAAIIVAAGRGSRAKVLDDRPKQYVPIGGTSVLSHTLSAFIQHADVDTVLPVIHRDDGDLYVDAVRGLPGVERELVASK